VTKRSVCGFTSVSEAENRKEIAIFAHSKLWKYLETHLGIPEDKQLPGTSCLAPHIVMGDEAFPVKTSLLKPYPGSQSKGGQ